MPATIEKSPAKGKSVAVSKELQNFDVLPASALVDVHVVSGLYGVAVGTTWRHVKAKLIPAPIHVGGRMTRWGVGELRAHIEEARQRPYIAWRCPTPKGGV